MKMKKKFNLKKFSQDHAAEILTIGGGVGLIGTTILAVRATPKAMMNIEDRKDELEVNKLKPLDTIKATWRVYTPAIAVGVVSLSCLAGSHKINVKRNAAIAAACTLSETAFRTYAAKTLEVVGEETEQEIRNVVGRQKIKEIETSRELTGDNIITVVGAGQVPCYDGVFGREFVSSIDELKKIENIINNRLRNEIYLSLNDYYYELGLKPVTIGDFIGWNIDDGYIEFKFGAELSDSGIPCLYVETSIMPVHSFKETYR